MTNFSVSFTVFEEDIYILSDYLEYITHHTHHIEISPSIDGGSVYKHATMFNIRGDKPPPEEVLHHTNEGYDITSKKVVKAIGAYITANAYVI